MVTANDTVSAYQIGDTDICAAKIPLPKEKRHQKASPLALHFVVDNSGSMGGLTDEVRRVFSAMVDSAATQACSLTLFSCEAATLSADIMTAQQMISLPTLPQGSTNIPAGIKEAMKVIITAEKNEISKGLSEVDKTHHILVLLTDGHHNNGAGPNTEFPKIGSDTRKEIPDVQLSIVVVGVTSNSSTSMGMLLKTSLETVPLDTNVMQNIYFASTTTAMKTVTKKLTESLNQVSGGIMHTITSTSGGKHLISQFGEDLVDTLRIRSMPEDSELTILFKTNESLGNFVLDGKTIPLNFLDFTDYTLVANTITKYIDLAKVKRVASNKSSSSTATINQLRELVDGLEKGIQEQNKLNELTLAGSRASERLAQHRLIKRTLQVTRELRNQLADIANFTANSSEEQAAFLTGNQGKYASKAMRRALLRNNDSNCNEFILDPKKEQDRIYSKLAKKSFADDLRDALRQDTINHFMKLNINQRKMLAARIESSSVSDLTKLKKLINSDIMKKTYNNQMTIYSEDSMPRSKEKVYTSALCWIPPAGKTYDSIQKVRQDSDKQVGRWPPHINLLYPFIPTDDFEDAAKALANSLRNMNPFDITLRNIQHFSHGSSCTGWLSPDEEEEFIALQNICQSIFPHCDDLSKRGEAGFIPHLTVGQFKNEVSIKSFTSKVKWQPSMTNCGEVCLISRKGKDDPFEVIWRVKLGQGKYIKGQSDSSEDNERKLKDTQEVIDPSIKDFLDSGTLSGYLNDTFFGGRMSYLSQMNSFEHISEWVDFNTSGSQVEFQSLWEMLLYIGSTGYPIILERSAATQLNPFQLSVKKVYTSMVDTASLCCANQSATTIYGPEGGEAIKDALVLVDPSLPIASRKILSTALLGEVYTSVVLSRDLHMYTGASMKIALMAHSLFWCLDIKNNASRPLTTNMDLVLRILYSFRQIFSSPGNPIRTWYNDLARKMVDWDLNSFTTADDVQSPVQIILAVMVCDDNILGGNNENNDPDHIISAAFAPPVILTIVNEAIAREARKKLSMASGGNDGKAKEHAIDIVTRILGISEDSAPTTTDSLLEPEPNRPTVEETCNIDYVIGDFNKEASLSREWAIEIATKWCKVLSFAKVFRQFIVKRGGGWDKLERDMETSRENYSDVIHNLQNTRVGTFMEMCEITKADHTRTITAIAAQAYLHSRGSQRQNLPDVRCKETIESMARDMRMCIYDDRVKVKMSQWKNEGEELAFARARAADIGQYTSMTTAKSHVHGLSKEMFWALWEAAVYDGSGGVKVHAFLQTACQSFHEKYTINGSGIGKKEGRRKGKRKKSKSQKINK